MDRKARTVRLEPGTTKNSDGRTLPYDLLPELADVIERQWQEHKRLAGDDLLCPYVFNREGARIRSIRGAWIAACKKAGCPGMLPHDFRRTAVRNLVRVGVPEKIAMSITGHKTRSVFDRYDIVNEADLRAALGKLASPPSETRSQGRVTRFR